jgi:hypothetical protein
MWSCHEALKFGRKDVQVTVLRLCWDPRATAPTLVDRLFRGRATRKVPATEPPPINPSPDGGVIEDTSSTTSPTPDETPEPDQDPISPPPPPAQ